MKRVLVLALLALGISGTAHAEFNYNFIQATYGQIDFDDFNVDGDNIGLDASLAITPEFHVFGGADFSDLDFNVDAQAFEAGLGYNAPITPLMDIIARISLQNIDVDTPAGSSDDTGLGVGVGLRINVTDFLELNAGIEYVDWDDSGENTAVTGAALINLSNRFAIGIVAEFDDDVEQYGLAGRLYF